MSVVKCPSCGSAVEVPEKKSGLPWLIGCLVALVAVPVIVGVIGLLAAIAIPSFVKARQTAQMNACVNNMRQIESAKESWALANSANTGAEVEVAAVNRIVEGGAAPICPAGGTYVYHQVGASPECSVHGVLGQTHSSPHSSRTNR